MRGAEVDVALVFGPGCLNSEGEGGGKGHDAVVDGT